MGLTSGLFIWLMIILAAGSVACTVWLWPRASGRGIGSLGSRLGLLAVTQMLVIAAFLVFINSYFAFYGSWAALLGGGTTLPVPAAASSVSWKPVVITRTEPGPPAGRRPVLPVSASRTPGHAQRRPLSLHYRPGGQRDVPDPHSGSAAPRDPAAVGKILQVTIRGQRTGIGVAGAYIYLPAQYFQPAYAHSRFPAVLALTGYPGAAESIVKRLGLPDAAATLVAAGRIRPAIYVMMNVTPAMPRDTECTNVPAGPQVETFFADDVPQAVESMFRVQTAGTGWAALGYSTGGYCAAKLAMMNPYQFSSAVSIAGYYTALQDHTTGNLYGGSQAYRNENNLDWRLTHLPAPPVSVLATSSRIGELTYPGTLAFLALVHSPMRGYSLILPQGGHNFRTWGRELPQSLLWLSRQLTPVLAAGSAGTGQQLARAARDLASQPGPGHATRRPGPPARGH
jgi:S-formylglutathione hydrolase FrmB